MLRLLSNIPPSYRCCIGVGVPVGTTSPSFLPISLFLKDLCILFFGCAVYCFSRAFTSRSMQGLLFVAVCGLLMWWFSCCRAQALGRMGFSSCGSQILERVLSGCDTWVQLSHDMWNLPRPEIEPLSPALAGGFLTTGPPEKRPISLFFKIFFNGPFKKSLLNFL